MADSDNRASKLYMGLLMGAMAIIGLGMFQADLYGNYGVSHDNLTYLDVSDEVVDQAENLRESMATEITGIAPLDTFIAGTYNTLILFLGIGNVYTSFIKDVGAALFIPAALLNIAIAAVVVSIIFMIIRAIIKVDI